MADAVGAFATSSRHRQDPSSRSEHGGGTDGRIRRRGTLYAVPCAAVFLLSGKRSSLGERDDCVIGGFSRRMDGHSRIWNVER